MSSTETKDESRSVAREFILQKALKVQDPNTQYGTKPKRQIPEQGDTHPQEYFEAGYLPKPVYSSPYTPSDPYVFNREPHEKRVHWLKLWAGKNDPLKVDCQLAFDTFLGCESIFSHVNSLYDHGTLRKCVKEMNGFRTCMRIKGMAISNPEKAKVSDTLSPIHERNFWSSLHLPPITHAHIISLFVLMM